MRPRTLLLLTVAALLGVALAVLPALAAAPSEVKLEVNENCVQAAWPCWATPGSGPNPSPASKVTLATGGTLEFVDDANTPATLSWTSAAPACSGIPASATTKWEGTCKFEQPGTYRFESPTLFKDASLDYTKYEVVVEGATTGTTTSTTTTTTTMPGTTTTPTTTTTAPTTPREPGMSAQVTLATSQRGTRVHGSISVTQANAGGRLEVGLFAARAALAKAGHPARLRVGRLVRPSLKAGRVSFAVPLNATGRAALRRHRRLAVTVKITLTRARGAAATVTRRVVVHV
jgi:hypothetical protein